MATIGRRKGVRRYGTAHGLRLSETMEYVCRQYALKAEVSLSDGMRLLLEQAVGQRVNAVEAQQAQLDRIEAKLADLEGSLAYVEQVSEAIQIVLDPAIGYNAQGEAKVMDQGVLDRNHDTWLRKTYEAGENPPDDEPDPFGPEGKYGPERQAKIDAMKDRIAEASRGLVTEADPPKIQYLGILQGLSGQALSPEEQQIWDDYNARRRE